MSLQLKGVLAVLVGGVAMCCTAQAGQLKEITQIPVMLDVPLAGFDISWVDPGSGRYVLTSFAARDPKDTSNPGNNALLLFDANTDKLVNVIHGVRGSGVVTANHGKEAWLGSGREGVIVVDLVAGKRITAIASGAKEGGGDEVAYDAKDGIVAVALPDDDPPTLILLSQKDKKIIARIPVPEATDGLEQTVYSPVDGMFWTDVPEMNHQKEKGGMLKVDPKTGKRVEIVPLDNCKPHGNAVGRNGELYLGCNFGTAKDGMTPQQAIFNVKTGKAVFVPGAGGTDETATDNGIGQYYSASAGNKDPGPVLAVVDAKTRAVIQKIPTKDRAHSVTADSKNHQVFVPESSSDGGCGCIRVFAPM
jgi:hypothetical protein